MISTERRRTVRGPARALRPGPLGASVASLAVLSLAVFSLAGTAAAQTNPFGAIRNMIPGMPKSDPKPKPDAAAPAAMGLQAGVAQPPLHGLGTDAVAVVEAASPGAPVQPMDYVFAKQTITLGPKGRITMSYLSGCLTEVIDGGVVTVALNGSKVVGGKRLDKPTPGCRTATPVVLAAASEAGATVNRVTPFTGVNWSERALKSGPPVFKWDKGVGAVTLRVKDMDKEGEPVLWQAAVAKDWVAYPPTAARLAPGMPYKAEALVGDKVVAAALFSIDPALDVADNLAGRVVPLAAP